MSERSPVQLCNAYGMGRRDFLAAASGAALLGASCAISRRSRDGEQRPDILFIAVEDMSPFLSCYGHPVVRTPHLDDLATRGVRFELAYCQMALCNPSRASVITGLRPGTTGVFGNATDWRTRVPDSMMTLPEFFRENGRIMNLTFSPHLKDSGFDANNEMVEVEIVR